MKINRLDHLMLTVANLQTTCDFYEQVLGMQVITFNGRKALAFGNQKINLHEKGKEFEPKAQYPTPGSADLCFISDTPVEEVYKELQEKQIPIIEGIVDRTGATGKIRSIYFRDPDQNLVEVSNY